VSGAAGWRLLVHVEDLSMETAIRVLLPKLLGGRSVECKVITHGSKSQMLRNLPTRLPGYEPGARVLVLIDRDQEDCQRLKARLEDIARHAGLPTKTSPDQAGAFRVVNRIAVEELEAWFLGDPQALTAAYPRLSPNFVAKASMRDPDAVKGGTCEALRRLLQNAGYDRQGKIAMAQRIAMHMQPGINRSKSFQAFACGLAALIQAN
jgi:hypothetical protein